MKHDSREGTIIFPNHGSQEIGKGLEKKILKKAGIKLQKGGIKKENFNDCRENRYRIFCIR